MESSPPPPARPARLRRERRRKQPPHQQPPPVRITVLEVKKKGAKVKKPSAAMLAAIDEALPPFHGQGAYWRNEVLNARCTYPQAGTTTPPRRCQRSDDWGRMYPADYTTIHLPRAKTELDPKNKAKVLPPKPRRGWRVCEDCRQAMALAHHRRLMREYGYEVSDESPSAAVLRALEDSGVVLEEMPLASEYPGILAAEIKRYQETGELPTDDTPCFPDEN